MSRALVISGGGSKGAYAVGIVNRLLREFPGLEFDMFVGTSTGSLIVPLVAMGEMQLLETLFTTQTTDKIVLENRLGDRISQNSIFNADPLKILIKTHYTEERYNNLLAGNKKIFLTTTCLQSGEMVVFTTARDAVESDHYKTTKLVNASHFRRAVMASACQPVFMPPQKVNENVPGDPNPDFEFVDGGVREYAGIQMAIDNGATEIFTILLSSGINTIENKQYTDLFSLLQRTIDIFTDDVGKNDLIIPAQYNDALRYIDAVKNKMKREGVNENDINEYFNIDEVKNPYKDKVPLKFFTFRPQAPLGGGPGGLTFNPVEMKQMLQTGEASAQQFIASLHPSDISWV